MNSIRFRLFIILVAATSFVWLSAFVWVQQSTRGKVERVLDARLAEAGQMVSSLMSDQRIDLNTLAVAATGEGKADGILQTDYSHKLSCQIWSLNGALVGSSGSAPLGKLTDQDTGFSTTVIEGEKWRVYSVVNEALGMRIMVGDSYKVRDRLVEDVTKGLALPALLMLPIMAALILVSVQRGLAPLERMAGALSQRPAEDLSPVSVTPLPREIKPMGDALNGLFSRVTLMRDREKSFTSFAAHELKTPLAAIKTQAQVAAMAPDQRTRLRALDQIQHGVGRADRMVRQLLALASLDSDDAFDEGEGQVAMTIQAVASDLARAAAEKQVVIKFTNYSERVMRTHTVLLSVAVRNVVENAIHASPTGASVDISLTDEGDRCHISVHDMGPGIPAEEIPRISARFYRGKGAKEGGSGLGLSIVAAALERLGGDINFQRCPKGGETVTLMIPVG
tara:strand:- start:1480 stop:2832 length:1353 start_codon:yes stop_codon:yes gene_type:complete